ncbi:hypothetical protein, partial [Microbacterium sp. ZXX196]|uniref:hypothetical protein n=1 Tax=Microbacterium sp. ZXX196 TaxID=2609291 RepID=UPI001E5C34C1
PLRAARVMARVREMHGGEDYSAEWATRLTGTGIYADLLQQPFKRAVKAACLSHRMPALRTDLFRVPPRPGDQLSLF